MRIKKKRNKIVASLRIKNEEKWLERCLKSLDFCESIVVLDDHSTDRTEDIARSFKNLTFIDSPFTGLQEVRDKNFLLEKVLEENPDWVISLDGDEEIEPTAAKEFSRILPIMEKLDPVPTLSFQFLYFWDSMDTYRFDGIYDRFWQARMFRVPKDTGSLKFIGDKAGFHCGSVPPQALSSMCNTRVRIKHYGYLERETRLQKYVWYNWQDKSNDLEDRYKHVTGECGPSVFCPGPMIIKTYE